MRTTGVLAPLLTKHSKSFNLSGHSPYGVDRIMDATAKLIFDTASSTAELEAPEISLVERIS
jgi:hypothetical protein